jgi:heme oxygenase (biliverdin-producing, ferredoxin)
MSAALALSHRLKLATRAAHGQAERGPMMQRLLAGRLPLADYCSLLRQLQALYQALEAGLAQQAGDPQVARLCPAALWRSPALADDLAHLQPLAADGAPERLHATAPLAPATLAYVARLQQLAQQAPLLLLAHAYVRYLGDLYGGQMLGRRLRQQHGLAEEAGTRFYAFGDAARVQALIGQFREALDALALSPDEADALVAEACEAFERHERIFEQLAPQPAQAAEPDAAPAA